MSDIRKEYVGGLREDHARFSRVLSLIGREARRLVEAPDEVLPVFEEAVDYIVNFQNVHHHPREEIMFAKLAERAPSLRQAARRLAAEHDGVGHAGESIQVLLRRAASETTSKESRKRLAKKLEQFADDMRAHIRQEEQLLYSHVWDELEAEDWEEMAEVAPESDPLSRLHSRRYPLLAEYVLAGTQRSDVSMDSSSFLEKLETYFDRHLSKTPRLRKAKSLARRHGEEAAAIGRRTVEALPEHAYLRPVRTARVGLVAACKFGAAYGRWIKDWHRYVWHAEEPHADS